MERAGSRKRLSVAGSTSECGGEVSFSFLETKSLTKVKYKCHHDTPPRTSLSVASRKWAKQLSEGGMSPFQIVTVLRAETEDVLLCSDVYSIWISVLERLLKQDLDPKLGAVKYLQ